MNNKENIKNNLILHPDMMRILIKLNELGCTPLLIGGCVRDSYLGIKQEDIKDIDVEVYGISYADLEQFLSKYGRVDIVGKSFGVIIFHQDNSQMKYDFSIPRKENKLGIGHKGFDITLDSNLSVKEAASRRDFSMNALAYDPITHELHDYYGGINDLDNKIIRHTSEKFTEDSLRILRAMNFQARFGFTIHPETIELMKSMLTDTNEFSLLAKERVFEEWMKWCEKGTDHSLIFKFMRDTGLIEYYPELKALKETPQDPVWHPEGDAEIHTYLCLKHMDKIIEREKLIGDEKVIQVMGILLHDIAKPKCTEETFKNGRMCITSNGHEEMGGEMTKIFLSSIGFHESLITPISNIIANHLAGVNISCIEAMSGKVKCVKKLSKKLFPATILQLLLIMEADSNGRGFDGFKEPTGAREIMQIATDLVITVKEYQYILMGRHLIEAGLKPSAEFTTILKASYEAQENGDFSDIEGAKQWLTNHLNKTLV